MRYLIDTHIAAWAKAEPERLSARTAELMIDPEIDIAFSVVCIWEVVIKVRKAPSAFRIPPAMLRNRLIADGFHELPITAEHVLAVASLTAVHGDPFDRMMVAQARVEGRLFLTADRTLAGYGDWIELV